MEGCCKSWKVKPWQVTAFTHRLYKDCLSTVCELQVSAQENFARDGTTCAFIHSALPPTPVNVNIVRLTASYCTQHFSTA